MMTPPPVSGTLFPTTVGAETRLNYLAASITANTAYIDNVLPGATTMPVSDMTYSILPTLSLNRTTPRQLATMTYSTEFTFYQPTSALNAVDQAAALTFQDRLTPGIAINLQDFFTRTSNVFNLSFPFTGGGITGSAQPPTAAVIAPFAEQLRNTANAAVTYQFARNGMVGVGGSFDIFNLPNPSQAPGLYDSSAEGAQAFYNRRWTPKQYGGLTYEYARTWRILRMEQTEVRDAHAASVLHGLLQSHIFFVDFGGNTAREHRSVQLVQLHRVVACGCREPGLAEHAQQSGSQLSASHNFRCWVGWSLLFQRRERIGRLEVCPYLGCGIRDRIYNN